MLLDDKDYTDIVIDTASREAGDIQTKGRIATPTSSQYQRLHDPLTDHTFTEVIRKSSHASTLHLSL